MPKPKPNEIDEELKKQQEAFDEPDEAEMGKDVEEDLERVIGNEPGKDEDGFSIAEEVQEDSIAAGNQLPSDNEEEEELQ